MPTIKTIKPDGTGDYTNLADWETFAGAQATADQWAECYSGGDLGAVSLAGWTATADATTHPKIYAAPGHETTGFGVGALMGQVTNTAGPAVYAVEGMRIVGTGITTRRTALLNKCCIDLSSTPLLLQLNSATPVGVTEIKNCLIRCVSSAIQNQPTSTTKDVVIDSCTLIGGSAAALDIATASSSGTHNLTLKNCVAVQGAAASFAKGGATTLNLTASNNASTDGTATSVLGGTGNQDNIVVADAFTNAAGSDYTLDRTGVLYRGGVATANTESLNDVTRHSPPDIGAYETLSPASLASDPTGPTDFGTIEEGATEPTQEFDITNSGEESATSVSVSVPTGFTITQDLPSTIAAGATETLIVKLNNTPVGEKSGNVSITSSVATVNVAVSGEVIEAPVADVAVGGNLSMGLRIGL